MALPLSKQKVRLRQPHCNNQLIYLTMAFSEINYNPILTPGYCHKKVVERRFNDELWRSKRYIFDKKRETAMLAIEYTEYLSYLNRLEESHEVKEKLLHDYTRKSTYLLRLYQHLDGLIPMNWVINQDHPRELILEIIAKSKELEITVPNMLQTACILYPDEEIAVEIAMNYKLDYQRLTMFFANPFVSDETQQTVYMRQLQIGVDQQMLGDARQDGQEIKLRLNL